MFTAPGGDWEVLLLRKRLCLGFTSRGVTADPPNPGFVVAEL